MNEPEEIDQNKFTVPPHKHKVFFRQEVSWDDSQLRPLVPTDGTAEERHETDKQMDGVTQVKCLTVSFMWWKDIIPNLLKKIRGKEVV